MKEVWYMTLNVFTETLSLNNTKVKQFLGHFFYVDTLLKVRDFMFTIDWSL